MPRLPCAFLIAYDGSSFRGWQRQPGLASVQQTLELALSKILAKKVQIFGAARTDAGVHAEGQVFHFVKEATDATPALDALVAKLRAELPAELAIRDAKLAHPSFHARSSSVAKSYRYRLSWGHAVESAPDRSRAFQLGPSARPAWDRARAALEEMSRLPSLPGLSSPSTDRRPAPPLEKWQLLEGETSCALEISAPAFRKHQLRNLAGHLAAIALGLAEPPTLAHLARVRVPGWAPVLRRTASRCSRSATRPISIPSRRPQTYQTEGFLAVERLVDLAALVLAGQVDLHADRLVLAGARGRAVIACSPTAASPSTPRMSATILSFTAPARPSALKV